MFKRIISVGDVVTSYLVKEGIIPFLSIIDGKTKRQVYVNNIADSKTIHLRNEPGVIRLSVMERIRKILDDNKKSTLLIDGEEDLLVIPAVMYGHIDDVIVYGQPNVGAVGLEVSDIMRWRVKDLLSKFIVKKCNE
ncbi:GTP-dependent dephospho-CoA kinase family protein [Candidatus Acidianus copahuensis]|nr:GTP-dependent dephospho-CoA kinase family protein [Candidatus Acidianus copahuensis]